MFDRALHYLLLAAGIIAAYEIVRALVVGSFRKRLTRSVKEFIESNRIRLDKFKFMHRVVVKHELLNDIDVHEAIIAHAREKNLAIRDVELLVEEYIDEIVPSFNLLSYYKVGYWLANLILNLVYEVVIDRESEKRLKQVPENSVIVFVMNHRSNIDYILVAFMLMRQISLSYAVGEWARVWPLEYIFKSFGAYFIRRKFREKLYHLVLEKYVQLISLQGVTQGIFIEGGLTRDGNFRKAKTGILDYIMRTSADPRFDRELVFIPAAINYDWILEDGSLIKEWKEGKEKSGLRDNLASLARIIGKGPFLLLINLFRYLTGRLKHHGYASASFGEPVFLSEYIKSQKTDIFTLDRYQRLSWVQEFADLMLVRIAEVMPVTPVCLVSCAILELGGTRMQRADLENRVAILRKTIKQNGGRIVQGSAFESSQESYNRLKGEEDSRKSELVSFETDFLDFEQARESVNVALELLKRRRIVTARKGEVYVHPKKVDLLEFYANSLNKLIR
jgi:glycerol-3-phosphate O-acyltransferase